MSETLNPPLSQTLSADRRSVGSTQPAALGGALDEFIFSGRLDNLANCFCAVKALTSADTTLESEPHVRMVALFDNEEVGSSSAMGAGGPVMMDTMKRITENLAATGGAAPHEAHVQALQKSFLVSADMAHALHPYASVSARPLPQG